MTLPTRKQQIEAVARFLDSERNEGRSLEEIASEIVDEFHDMLLSAVKKPATPLRLGMLLKSPYDGKVRRVAWLNDGDPIGDGSQKGSGPAGNRMAGKVWIVNDTSSYGWLGTLSPPTWEYFEEFRPKQRIEVDGKGKMVEMTDAEIEEAWTRSDLPVGSQFSQHQREYMYEVIATGPQCVLMKNIKTGNLAADSVKNLEQYYKRESNLGSEW